jgi:hypothetical protein
MSRKTINVAVEHALGAAEALRRLGSGDASPHFTLRRVEAKFVVGTPVGEVSGQLTVTDVAVRVDTNENPRLVQLFDSTVESRVRDAIAEKLSKE